MARFNMVFNVGLVGAIKTARETTARTDMNFFGIIMVIRKNTINPANSGKDRI